VEGNWFLKVMEFEQTTKQIIGAAYTVYNKMGFGYLESVYEKCLGIEFQKAGLKAKFRSHKGRSKTKT